MNKEEIEALIEMKNNCLNASVYDDEKRLIKANAITRALMLLEENKKLKEQLANNGIVSTCENCEWFEVCPHSYKEYDYKCECDKLKEEVETLSKDVDMWNKKYNDVFDENKKLQNRIDEVTKICLARQKYISDCETKIVILENQLEVGEQQYNHLVEEKESLQEQLSSKDLQLEEIDYTVIPNSNIKPLIDKFKTQQKEFIKYLKDMLDNENDIFSVVRVKDVLNKYKEIIGGKK